MPRSRRDDRFPIVSLSDDPPRRGGRGPDLSETTLFHPRMICPAGQGPHLSETTLFQPRMICPAGQGPHLSETTLGRRDAKSSQEIELKGVGESLTSYLKHSVSPSGGGGLAYLKHPCCSRYEPPVVQGAGPAYPSPPAGGSCCGPLQRSSGHRSSDFGQNL